MPKQNLLIVITVAFCLFISGCMMDSSAELTMPTAPKNQSGTDIIAPTTSTDAKALVENGYLATKTLIIALDATESGNSVAQQEFAEAIHRSLSSLIKTYCITEVKVLELKKDGHTPLRKFDILLPKFTPPTAVALDSEAEIFGGVQKAEQEKVQKDFDDAWDKHNQDIQTRLLSVTPETFVPTIGNEPKCSDLIGFLEYLADFETDEGQIVLLGTDGKETCSTLQKDIALPDKTIMAIFVLPLAEDEIKDVSGLDADYIARKKQMQMKVPQAVVAGYNSDIFFVVKKSAASKESSD